MKCIIKADSVTATDGTVWYKQSSRHNTFYNVTFTSRL